MWLVDTVLDNTDIEHFHHCRELFYWTLQIFKLLHIQASHLNTEIPLRLSHSKKFMMVQMCDQCAACLHDQL